MTDPAELSRTFLDAFNRRDLEQMEGMINETVFYKFAGQTAMTTRGEVLDFYRRLVEGPFGDQAYAAIVKILSNGDRWATLHLKSAVDDTQPQQVVLHEWERDRLFSYRQFIDTAPQAEGWVPADE